MFFKKRQEKIKAKILNNPFKYCTKNEKYFDINLTALYKAGYRDFPISQEFTRQLCDACSVKGVII